MPADLPPPRRRPKRRVGRRGRTLLIVLLGFVVVLFASARALSGFFVEALWFESVGQSTIFWDVLKTKVLLAMAFTVGFVALCYASLSVADRLAPIVRTDGPEEQVLQRYRDIVGHRQSVVWLGGSVLFGLIAGVPAAAQWQSWTLFRRATSFGVKDAQFGADVGFYVFRLPFLSFLVNWLFASFLVIGFLTAVAHYANGGIRLQPGGRRVTSHVKLHLSGIAALLAVLKAADYWLQRFELTTSSRGYVDGATFTDVKAQLPALQLLILISLLAAVLLIVNVWQRGWRLPVISVGLWVLVASIAGTVYPAIVQRFQVESSESRREAPYIDRNIAATRAAFGLGPEHVTTVPFSAGEVTAAAIEESAPAFADVRLMDPSIVGDTFRAIEGQRAGYRIGDLDVDRYVIDGRRQQVVLAARELDATSAPLTTWEGQHLAYTHGYGVAFAPASQVRPGGRPVFTQVTSSDNELGLTQPELYVGDGLDGYAVVRTNREGGEESLDGANQPYAGTGGVKLDSALRRAAFAVHFGEYNLFGSKLITDESRIIYHRDIRDRVQRLAPFLSLDADPYPVVFGGRVHWVIDAYTTSDRYPYSQRAPSGQLPVRSGLRHTFNYVRNPVKAVVDAYDGTVTLYIVDESDPIIQAWELAFPRLFKGSDEVPAELREHFRYPEDLFRVLTSIYGRYHIGEAQAFYSQRLGWSVAQEAPAVQPGQTVESATNVASAANVGQVTDSGSTRFDPYYSLFRPVGEATADPTFSLLRPFVPFSKQDERKELQAFMVASGDPATYGQLTAYVLDQQPLPDGPLTVAAAISQRFNAELTLLDQKGSRVLFGDLQLVPAGGGLVYVRPWYTVSEANPIPELLSVSVTYRNRAERGDTLTAALRKLFPAADVELGEVEGNADDPSPVSPPSGSDDPEDLLVQADGLFAEAQEAKAAFDSKTYQDKIEQAYELVRQAAEAAAGVPVSVAPAAPPTTASA